MEIVKPINSEQQLKVKNVDDPVICVDTDTDSESNNEAVIDLDDYVEYKKKPKLTNCCINFECKNVENLVKAPVISFHYFRAKQKPRLRQEICRECLNEVEDFYENLSASYKNGENILIKKIPKRNDFVEIDSDEENDNTNLDGNDYMDIDCVMTEVEHQCIRDLPKSLEEVLHKYNFQNNVDNSINYLINETKSLSTELNSINDIHKQLQNSIDKMRTTIYSAFKPPTKSLPSIEIVDTNFEYILPLSAVSPPKRGERRSNRSTPKPVSYCELIDEIEPQDSPELSTVQNSKPIIIQTISSPIQTMVTEVPLPPEGPLVKTKPIVGEYYYAQKQTMFNPWGKVRLLEIKNPVIDGDKVLYRVRFEGKMKNQSNIKFVTGKELAYSNPSSVRLVVGVRVIAVFMDENSENPLKESYFLGVVAEPMSELNNWRYLIFFDDGYAQYVKHEKILVVCESSQNVWEDIHPDSKTFIKDYLERYPDRPMVKLKPTQVVKTEWNGKWWIARVMQVDGSLVQMYFEADQRSEWIYRGSARLGPLFLELQAAASRRTAAVQGVTMRPMAQQSQVEQPYVQYSRPPSQPEVQVSTGIRAVARKSTSRPPNTLPGSQSSSNIINNNNNNNINNSSNNTQTFLPNTVVQPQSKVVYFTPKSIVKPKTFMEHECTLECGKLVTLPFKALQGYNPLSKPLLLGWHRQVCKYKGKRTVRYRTPCGRSLRGMSELHKYLREIRSPMSVDNFDFDFWVHCLAEFVLDKMYRSKRDISEGIENVPIPCVNYVDDSLPDFIHYSTKREPKEGVNLNLDEEFLCGCDCTDDCADKSKCACWQLTIREARTLHRRVEDNIGYCYKRLPDCVTTGIYECNSRCKCAVSTCLNRVAQHPLQLKLQLFKTTTRGWGIRCLNDIPQGAFICIYAGSLLTDKMANEGGVTSGDEYLAELDYIEVVERQKDGYESDVTDIEECEEKLDEDYVEDKEEEEEFKTNVKVKEQDSPVKTRSSSKKQNVEVKDDEEIVISDDDDIIREKSSFAPQSVPSSERPASPKFKSVRKMYGEDEVCYIMDAKVTGNIGRFLNHSCNPNVFVQNVFVDTHDLRFPWVAFFALSYIRAGTELTWNYNYDVGCVPGKVIFCHCGSHECRGRLL